MHLNLAKLDGVMVKLQLAQWNLGIVFNFSSGDLHAAHLWCYGEKLPNIKFKTQSKEFIGSTRLEIMPPAGVFVPGKPFQSTEMYHSSFLGPFLSYDYNEVLWIKPLVT
jgi:hypothetical protein